MVYIAQLGCLARLYRCDVNYSMCNVLSPVERCSAPYENEMPAKARPVCSWSGRRTADLDFQFLEIEYLITWCNLFQRSIERSNREDQRATKFQ